jgi:hypothetical protein
MINDSCSWLSGNQLYRTLNLDGRIVCERSVEEKATEDWSAAARCSSCAWVHVQQF